MKRTRLLFLILFLAQAAYAQVPNDECQYALPLPAPHDYCSAEGEFSNIGATEDAIKPSSTCLFNFKSAVWFSFVVTQPAVVIRVTGSAGEGTLVSPQVGLYSGDCNSLVQAGCASTTTGQGVVELYASNLVIGQVYYIMVDGLNGETGTFQLCVNDFIPPPDAQADCDQAVILCDKQGFQVQNLIGTGSNNNEVDPNSCIEAEFASTWYKWTCDQPGTLTFTITPNNYNPNFETDDIDFALYRLPGGLDDCANKELIRCMASGANVGQPYSSWAICNGPTGLSESSSDVSEDPGCSNGSDNFVSAVNMQAGESYALLVNNFSQSGLGFSIEFGGTGTFLGPEVNFGVDAVATFECDKTITFTDSSLTDVGNIVSWNWNFGAGANPLSANTPGPHDVIYDSFGDKIAALTIESDQGCRVTKIVDFFVKPCCEDFPDLDLAGEVTDNLCAGDSTGQILAQGIAGNGGYQYSLDGVNFQPSPLFPFLPEGDYEVYVQDKKGCLDSMMLSLMDPPPLIVYAGEDIQLTLGDSALIAASYSPPGEPVQITWLGPLEWLNCDTCLTPMARPFRTTDYVIEITNENGCISRDTMLFNVEIIRPFYAPNAFSPNGDGVNEKFSVFSTNIGLDIDELMVFDRWGNLLYRDKNVRLNDPSAGWDGTAKGKKLPPGVYAWVAKVRYLDDAVILFSGDVTLVR